jgi:hypothetical protein
VNGEPRVQYRLRGIYPDGWTGRTATIERYACNGSTTLRLRQGAIFDGPQTVLVNGVSYRVRGKRAVRVADCTVTITVPVTKVPGPADPRELGIIVDGFS